MKEYKKKIGKDLTEEEKVFKKKSKEETEREESTYKDSFINFWRPNYNKWT